MPDESAKTQAVETPPVIDAVAASATPEPGKIVELTREQILESLQKTDTDAERAVESAGEISPETDATSEKGSPATETAPAKEVPKTPTPEEIQAERKKLEEDRAEFERQKRDFDERAAAAKREIQSAEQQAEQLERYAKEWEESGDKELAQTARDRAAKLRTDINHAKREASNAEFRRAQEATLRRVVAKFPELSKPDSQFTKDMDALLRSRPAMLSYPEGISDAAEFLAARDAGTRLQASEKENADLRKQVADLQRRLQPASKGATTAPRGEKSFAQLTPDEQRKRLLDSMRREEVAA